MIAIHAYKLCLIILLLTGSRFVALAEEWNGVVPGVATRSDIIRLFQQCNDRGVPCEFEVQGDKVRIVFSGMVQDYFYQCARKLPADTVLLVEVTPRLPLSLKSLRQRYSLNKLATMSEFSAYIDERAGLILKAHRDNIIQLNHVAAASDRFRCEDYYDDPIKFALVVTHCPPVTLEGPGATIAAGEVLEFKADVQPDPKMTLVWTVSGGKILNQLGRQISVDTSGLDGQTLKVTIQALGSCSVENSMTLQIRRHAP